MFVTLLTVLVFVGAESIAFQVPGNGTANEPRLRRESYNNASLGPNYFNRRSCDVEQPEYRLTKLEVQMAEKSEYLLSELREDRQRLQVLEWQSVEVQKVLESLQNDLGRCTETNQRQVPVYSPSIHQPDKLELRVDNLAEGIQSVVAALKGINADIANVKRNISSIVKDTRTLPLNQDDVARKPFPPAGLPKNCKEVQERGHNISGIYSIQPELAPKAFMVLCDMNTRGGGWTYIHNRYEGVQDFYLNWDSYKLGFGNLGGEFWLGLEYLHQLTGSRLNELLIELVDMDLGKAHAHYSAFSVGNELEGYSLKVLGSYSGDAGDSLIYHAGGKFSTKDKDQDGWPEGSCAQDHTGAWWYKFCDRSNLNGKYLRGDLSKDHLYQGMYWWKFRGGQYSLLRARMMVRPRDDSFNFVLHH